MNQGDIYIVNLDPTVCTEIGKTRPGMIKIYPFEVSIPKGRAGLDKDSKIMLDQLRSLDKKRLHKKIGTLDKETLSKACAIAQRLIAAD